ncbi:hypothetical protein LOAG_07366 [Loa loa]|uniref:Uncharacterized protein n=1 Tax=Loa loa TaxID=7209 RepID=A0A1S0TVY6_LOALO|nr:hypothetical protein LOAG_07366 [Loa loa]EFO21126.1 hypothetical protein LOAG_07366 [Loa loa]
MPEIRNCRIQSEGIILLITSLMNAFLNAHSSPTKSSHFHRLLLYYLVKTKLLEKTIYDLILPGGQYDDGTLFQHQEELFGVLYQHNVSSLVCRIGLQFLDIVM